MTTENETSKTKTIPHFYIFEPVDGQNENRLVGSIFLHRKGAGQTLYLNGKRYVAFAPRAKPEA